VTRHPYTGIVFLGLLGLIALAGIGAGTALAVTGYSSAGAFAVASACVGVLGTLVAQREARNNHGSDTPES